LTHSVDEGELASSGVCCIVGMEFRAVFVSTVRSRHRVSQMSSSVGEFGFLSEAQLVNTALTRAKSWLAVIGDPVALCSVGNCGALWRTYLKHCQKVGGIHPADLSLEDIWQHSQSLMNLLSVSGMSAERVKTDSVEMGHVVRQQSLTDTSADNMHDSVTVTATEGSATQAVFSEIAEAFGRQDAVEVLARRVSVDKSKEEEEEEEEEEDGDDDDDDDDDDSDDNDDTVTTSSHAVTSSTDTAHAASKPAIISFAEWSLDYQLEPDEIIRQLAMVCIDAVVVLVSSSIYVQKCLNVLAF